MVDPGKQDGGQTQGSRGYSRHITEPSPLLPPSLGVSSLFPGVAAFRQDSLDGKGDPIASWRRSPPDAPHVGSSSCSTAGSSIGLTDDSPRFYSHPTRSGSIEEQAATLLLSFSSPEVLTPMHYPAHPNGGNGVYLDKWTLDQSVEHGTRRPTEGWVRSQPNEEGVTIKEAKTASDILDMRR
jgi:hypothetical protein